MALAARTTEGMRVLGGDGGYACRLRSTDIGSEGELDEIRYQRFEIAGPARDDASCHQRGHAAEGAPVDRLGDGPGVRSLARAALEVGAQPRDQRVQAPGEQGTGARYVETG